MKEHADYWHIDDSDPVDFLNATYYTHSFPRHTHDDYVIGVVYRGVEAFTRNGIPYDAEPGRFVLINPGEMHTGYAAYKDGWSYRSLYPAADLIRRIAEEDGRKCSGYPGFSLPVINDPLLASDFLKMHYIHETSPFRLEREESLRIVMGRLISLYSDSSIHLKENEYREPHMIGEVCSYLSSHYQGNPSLRDLSLITGLTPWYLTRTFTRIMGVSPHNWLNQYRLKRARSLLLSGWKPAAVAGECGFSDQSHFTRHFKKYYGITPGKIFT